MIRAAAKNFPGVVVLTDPADWMVCGGTLSDARRRALAAKAFAHTAAYDAVVAEYLRDPGVASGSCLLRQAGAVSALR